MGLITWLILFDLDVKTLKKLFYIFLTISLIVPLIGLLIGLFTSSGRMCLTSSIIILTLGLTLTLMTGIVYLIKNRRKNRK